MRTVLIVFIANLILFACNEDQELDLRSTAPTINLSINAGDTALIRPDSILLSGTDQVLTYIDTLSSYNLPLDITSNSTTYEVYFSGLRGSVILIYELVLIDDIDKIRYIATLRDYFAINFTSAELECEKEFRCTTDDTTITLSF